MTTAADLGWTHTHTATNHDGRKVPVCTHRTAAAGGGFRDEPLTRAEYTKIARGGTPDLPEDCYKMIELAPAAPTHKPMITRRGVLGMQVCVPGAFTNKEVERFANGHNPSGTSNGWTIRKQGDRALAGCDERVPCEDASRSGCFHIMLDC